LHHCWDRITSKQKQTQIERIKDKHRRRKERERKDEKEKEKDKDKEEEQEQDKKEKIEDDTEKDSPAPMDMRGGVLAALADSGEEREDAESDEEREDAEFDEDGEDAESDEAKGGEGAYVSESDDEEGADVGDQDFEACANPGCQRKATQRCNGCSAEVPTAYCGRKCQMAHFDAEHKNECAGAIGMNSPVLVPIPVTTQQANMEFYLSSPTCKKYSQEAQEAPPTTKQVFHSAQVMEADNEIVDSGDEEMNIPESEYRMRILSGTKTIKIMHINPQNDSRKFVVISLHTIELLNLSSEVDDEGNYILTIDLNWCPQFWTQVSSKAKIDKHAADFSEDACVTSLSRLQIPINSVKNAKSLARFAAFMEANCKRVHGLLSNDFDDTQGPAHTSTYWAANGRDRRKCNEKQSLGADTKKKLFPVNECASVVYSRVIDHEEAEDFKVEHYFNKNFSFNVSMLQSRPDLYVCFETPIMGSSREEKREKRKPVYHHGYLEDANASITSLRRFCSDNKLKGYNQKGYKKHQTKAFFEEVIVPQCSVLPESHHPCISKNKFEDKMVQCDGACKLWYHVDCYLDARNLKRFKENSDAFCRNCYIGRPVKKKKKTQKKKKKKLSRISPAPEPAPYQNIFEDFTNYINRRACGDGSCLIHASCATTTRSTPFGVPELFEENHMTYRAGMSRFLMQYNKPSELPTESLRDAAKKTLQMFMDEILMHQNLPEDSTVRNLLLSHKTAQLKSMRAQQEGRESLWAAALKICSSEQDITLPAINARKTIIDMFLEGIIETDQQPELLQKSKVGKTRRNDEFYRETWNLIKTITFISSPTLMKNKLENNIEFMASVIASVDPNAASPFNRSLELDEAYKQSIETVMGEPSMWKLYATEVKRQNYYFNTYDICLFSMAAQKKITVLFPPVIKLEYDHTTHGDTLPVDYDTRAMFPGLDRADSVVVFEQPDHFNAYWPMERMFE
jgi:hypothetical protein